MGQLVRLKDIRLTSDPARRGVHTKQQYLVKSKSGKTIMAFDDCQSAYRWVEERATKGVKNLRIWSQTTVESELEYQIEENAHD